MSEPWKLRQRCRCLGCRCSEPSMSGERTFPAGMRRIATFQWLGPGGRLLIGTGRPVRARSRLQRASN